MKTNKLLQKIKNFTKHLWRLYDETAREKAVDSIETELGEMENIFGLLVLGSFVGLPAPPAAITLELLPVMEEHLKIMLNKTGTAHDPLSDLLSVFDAG